MNYSLLVHRYTTDFCMLVLYPQFFWNCLLDLNYFVCRILKGFLHIRSCYIQTKIILLLHCQFGYLLFLFLCLARNSNTMLKGSCGSEHPCLVPDLRGKAFSLLPLSMMLAVGLFSFNIYLFIWLHWVLVAACGI